MSSDFFSLYSTYAQVAYGGWLVWAFCLFALKRCVWSTTQIDCIPQVYQSVCIYIYIPVYHTAKGLNPELTDNEQSTVVL